MRGTVIAVLTLCCALAATSASAASLQRVTFDSATQRLASGGLIAGDRIEGHLAKPPGAGPFPAVIGLHGCAGMHEMTRQKFTDGLIARGYAVLLVESHAPRGIEHACTSAAFATFLTRRPDAYGALVFLSRLPFVDPERIAVVGFSAGARVSLSVAEPNAFDQFLPAGKLRLRAAAAFYPPCKEAMARPAIPTLILIGALDDWTPAAACSDKITRWGNEGPPVELVVYPGTHHGFYYPQLRRGATYFSHRLEYNAAAADNAARRLFQFLDRYVR